MLGGVATSKFWKRTPVVALATAAVLLLTGVLLAIYIDRANTAQKIDEIAVQGRILASTVTAALVFDDRPAAQEYVNALSANPEIQVAAVYDAGGRLFASYAKPPETPPPMVLRSDDVRFDAGRLVTETPIVHETGPVGVVYLRTNPESLASRVQRYGPILLLATMTSLVIGVLGAAHAALARANAELETRAVALAAANLDLQMQIREREKVEEVLRQAQKMEAVGQLTGGIAHDFNNLLTAVLGSLHLLRKRLPVADDPKVGILLDNAVQGAQKGASLTQRLLSFGRRQALKPEAADIPRLVHSLADLLRSSVGSGVEIAMSFPPDLPPAHVDVNQLELALLNLCVNARDAMPNGGRLLIAGRGEQVCAPDPAAPAVGAYVVLSVTDTGEGMDGHTLARAMEPFFTTKEVGRGTGLGLSMVHGLAAQSGGRLLLHSRKGDGTTAELWLPESQAG